LEGDAALLTYELIRGQGNKDGAKSLSEQEVNKFTATRHPLHPFRKCLDYQTPHEVFSLAKTDARDELESTKVGNFGGAFLCCTFSRFYPECRIK